MNANGANWTDYRVSDKRSKFSASGYRNLYFTITASNATVGPVYSTPLTAGTNNLTFDVVEEAVSWFGDNGGVGPGNSKYISPAQTIVALPTAVTVTGAGTFCGSTTLTAANGGSGTIYFQGTTSGGTSTATPASSAGYNNFRNLLFQGSVSSWLLGS